MAKDGKQTQDRVERVKRLLRFPHAHVRALIGVLHPTEVAQVLEDSSPELQERIIREVPREIISEAMAEMDDNMNPGQLLTLLNPRVASELINELAPDDAADLLAQLSDEERTRILTHISDEDEVVLNQLLTYDEDSAGGLMNPDVIKVQADMKKMAALREMVNQSEETDDFYTIYVVDETDTLLGYLTFKALFKARNSELVRNIMEEEIVYVFVDDDQEEVAKKMSQYNLPTLPVIDHEHKLIGRITFDDILDVIQEENTEDLLNLVGVSEGANLRGGWASSVKSRIPWLLVNLITASIAASVILSFEDTLNEIVILAIFMPIIAGVAGNGATQTLGVTIRRISTDGIPSHKAYRVVFKEILVGVANGLMIGTIVSLVALAVMYVKSQSGETDFDPQIGVVVFFAMFGNLTISGLMGSFVPITLEKLGVDPAIASSILITAFTDVIGYLLLFGLATLILL